jgi:hypothetical protein
MVSTTTGQHCGTKKKPHLAMKLSYCGPAKLPTEMHHSGLAGPPRWQQAYLCVQEVGRVQEFR